MFFHTDLIYLLRLSTSLIYVYYNNQLEIFSALKDTSSFIPVPPESHQQLLSWDLDAERLCCRDTSQGLRRSLLKGDFRGKITECSVNPAQREAVGSLSRGRINESSLGFLASFMAFSRLCVFLCLTFQFSSTIFSDRALCTQFV